jgi:uncharacterized membrane protein
MAEETKPTSSSGGSKNIGMAILCYIWILVLIPLLTDAKKDPFVKFHIKQGLVLLIVSVIVGAVSWIPVVGWLLGIGVFIVWLIGIINAASGKEEKLPIIGQFGDKFNI